MSMEHHQAHAATTYNPPQHCSSIITTCHCKACRLRICPQRTTMARPPSDATRFTPTGLHAAKKSTNPSTSPSAVTGTRINFGEAPPNETAQQKIARLRAAAAFARQGQEDRFDKVVRVGRRWADRAHRFTGYSLLAFTVVSLVVAVAGTTDIVIHNRRRRKVWYEEQAMKREVALNLAQKALAAGQANEEQLLLIAQERARYEAANRPGMFKRASDYLFGGLATEEKKGGRLGAAAGKASEKTSTTLSSTKTAVVDQLRDNAAESIMNVPTQSGSTSGSTSASPRSGGLLDQHAQNLVDATVGQGQSWSRWLTRT